MSITSRRVVTPIAGKSALAIERSKRLVAILNRAGAAARAARVAIGDGAGNLEVYARFANFSAGTQAMQTMAADPEFKAFNEEREKEPAATVSGPYVYRTVYGEPTAQPVLVQRIYKLPRSHLQNMLALFPEVRALFDSSVGISGVIPVFAPEMDSLGIVYYNDSLDSMGRVLDTVGLSEGFQNIVTKAAQYATLVAARVLTVI
jgi:hypothetical protein